VDAYEIGMKSVWREAGVTLNLAAFRSIYQDLQLAVPVSVGTAIAVVTRNVAGLESQGLELDVVWAPNLNWRFGLSAAWLDASYEDFANGPCTVLQGMQTPSGQVCLQNLSGQAPPYAPDYSGRFSVGTIYPLGSSGLQWTSELSYNFTDEFDVLTSNEPYVRSPAYEKLDARLGMGDPGGRWELAAVIRNVTDERTWSWGQQLGLGAGHFQVIADAPRTVALQGQYRWLLWWQLRAERATRRSL
jgi:outer membrane receptor protein involved in Fe transport